MKATTIPLKSSYFPPDRLTFVDWELYLKVRSVQKVNTVRRLNIKINQILGQNNQLRG